jgi:hypothetical protein
MAQRTIETRQRTPAQLLGALRGNVHEEKTAGDGCGARLGVAGTRLIVHVYVMRHVAKE